VIEDGMVVVRDDRVVTVSKAGPLPEGAEVLDARGRTLTPGWIATETGLGLLEIELEASTVDVRPRSENHAPLVRAAYSAADGYNPLSTLLAVARREGVTSAVMTPEGGLIAGSSAWIDLLDSFPPSGLVREDLALHADVFETDRSRPLAVSLLRDALESARLYARSPEAYDQGRTRPLSLPVRDLARIARVLGGALPLVVRVARAGDIQRLLALGREYGLRLILSGAEEAWIVAREVAAAAAAVIIDPTRNLPVSFSKLEARSENAALLAAAGARVVISTFDSHGAHNLRQLAGNAVASGLPADAALRALTSEAAKAFGLENDYGLLAPGRVANLCVWNGDPFELQTWAVEVVIRGRSVSTSSRQSALFERYRNLDHVPRGRAGFAPSKP
jgi:imidazolonepropionase-like amidohydrolase